MKHYRRYWHVSTLIFYAKHCQNNLKVRRYPKSDAFFDFTLNEKSKRYFFIYMYCLYVIILVVILIFISLVSKKKVSAIIILTKYSLAIKVPLLLYSAVNAN